MNINTKEKKTDKPWTKKYWTKRRHESDESFHVFQLSLQHPTWSYKKLSKKTGISENTIYDWSRKYHYQERKDAKMEYEANLLDKVQLESKINSIQKNATRNMLNEELLDAYAEFNQKLITWLDVDVITPDVLAKQRIVNKHLNEYFDLQNKHLKNVLDTEQLIQTLEHPGRDVDDEALRGLAGALLRSHQRIKDTLK